MISGKTSQQRNCVKYFLSKDVYIQRWCLCTYETCTWVKELVLDVMLILMYPNFVCSKVSSNCFGTHNFYQGWNKFGKEGFQTLGYTEHSVTLNIRLHWTFGYTEHSVTLNIRLHWTFGYTEHSVTLNIRLHWTFGYTEHSVTLNIRLHWTFGYTEHLVTLNIWLHCFAVVHVMTPQGNRLRDFGGALFR